MDSFRPLVRFAGFEGEWEMVIADELFTTFNEKNFPNLPVLSATQDRGMVTRESFGYNIAHDKSNEATYKHVLPGQFVIHLRSFQGGFAHSAIEGIVSPAYTILEFRTKDEQSDLFWKYIFSSRVFINRLSLITYGIRDGRSINFNEFKELSFILPSLPEQQKISEYFTEIDRAISLQTQKLSKLQQIKAASLQNMFPQEGQMLPKVRFAGFEGEWERVRLGEIAQFFKGKGYSKNDLTEKGSPIFLYGMMYTKYRFAVNEVDTYTDKDFSSLLSQGNEVIIPASGETAEDIACASAFLIKDVILGGDLNVICFDLSLYSTPFIALSISNGSSRKYLSKCAQGKSVVHLRNSDIKTVVLSLPSLPEQQAIANYFTKLDRKIELETQKLEKLKQIKSACLSKMFV